MVALAREMHPQSGSNSQLRWVMVFPSLSVIVLGHPVNREFRQGFLDMAGFS